VPYVLLPSLPLNVSTPQLSSTAVYLGTVHAYCVLLQLTNDLSTTRDRTQKEIANFWTIDGPSGPTAQPKYNLDFLISTFFHLFALK
jgi:hypothetical protein